MTKNQNLAFYQLNYRRIIKPAMESNLHVVIKMEEGFEPSTTDFADLIPSLSDSPSKII